MPKHNGRTGSMAHRIEERGDEGPKILIRRRRWQYRTCLIVVGLWMTSTATISAFSLQRHSLPSTSKSAIILNGANDGMYGRRTGGGAGSIRDGKSKRQERVGQMVHTEVSRMLHTGIIKGQQDVGDSLDAALRCRISVVRADVSPDLRQARISVSVRPTTTKGSGASSLPDDMAATAPSDENDDDRRLAHAWLVRNAQAIRHTVAQRMSHIKSSCPALTFVPVDVTAAVDVMHLIDKVTAGSDKRGGMVSWDPEEMARGMMGRISSGGSDELDFEDDDLDDDDDWEETDVDFFKPKK